MTRATSLVAAMLVSAVLASAGLGATDPVKDTLRRLKARVKSAKTTAAAKPKPASTVVTPPLRRTVRYPRNYTRPQAAAPRSFAPTMPVLKHDVDYTSKRLGTIPNTGDIVVETTNHGQIVFAYWKVYPISGPDGMGQKKDLAPAKYQIMLKGPSLRKPWYKFVQVKPDMVAVLKVELPENG